MIASAFVGQPGGRRRLRIIRHMASVYDSNPRAERAFGKKDVSVLGSGPTLGVPWKPAGHRTDVKDFDENLVREAIKNRHNLPLTEIDPRTLRATQPHLVRAAVQHYMEHPEELYADKHNEGNETPIVYRRQPPAGSPDWARPDNMVLTGHHRAAARLLRGEQFKAIVLDGPYGGPRD